VRRPVVVIKAFTHPIRGLRDFIASLLTALDQDEPLLCQCDLRRISSECAPASADGLG